MTLDFYDAVNGDGLFDVQGKAFHAQATLNTARGTTIPDEVVDLLEQFNNLTVSADLETLVASIPSALSGFQGAGSGLQQTLRQFSQDLLIQLADADNPLPAPTLQAALEELIAQMLAGSESVDASAVTASVSTGSNTGNGVLLVSTKRGDGLVQENLLAEVVNVEATSDGIAAPLQFTGETSLPLLDHNWPAGSGVARTVTAVDASASLLANGDMEDEDDVANAPDDWIITPGTIGTTVKMTDVEIQTLVMSGTPSAGHYRVGWANADGDVVYSPTVLAYDATASALQAALRLIPGLGSVTVTATGTSPDLTHTITFIGRGGNVAQLVSINNTTGGTITHGTTSGGTAQVYAGGKALELDSDGSQLTALYQRLTNLAPRTAYGISLWAIADVVPEAGVITVDLVDGVGGTVIQDAQGTNNAITFDAEDLTTSWQHLSELVSGETVFRTPRVLPTAVYLRIRISTAVSSGTSVFLDHVALAEMIELYAGGPLVRPFTGSKPFRTGDTFTLTTTNDRGGAIQEWYQRNFDMAALGLLLPSNAAGSETIPDSVVG